MSPKGAPDVIKKRYKWITQLLISLILIIISSQFSGKSLVTWAPVVVLMNTIYLQMSFQCTKWDSIPSDSDLFDGIWWKFYQTNLQGIIINLRWCKCSLIPENINTTGLYWAYWSHQVNLRRLLPPLFMSLLLVPFYLDLFIVSLYGHS